MLTRKIEVQYEGDDKLLLKSPVFDVVQVPVEVPGKLVGQSGMTLITFFLVFSNSKQKKMFWIRMENCDVVWYE